MILVLALIVVMFAIYHLGRYKVIRISRNKKDGVGNFEERMVTLETKIDLLCANTRPVDAGVPALYNPKMKFRGLFGEVFTMPSAISVANWFVNNLCDCDSGSVVTHLQVQKMLYFAQAWHMMVMDAPLFEEDMEAWPHGPVVPSVWQKFKQYGWNPIQPGGDSDGIDKESENVLIQVLDVYGAFGAKKLEAMAHAERPWIDARGSLAPEERCNAIIPKNAILSYYKQVYGDIESAEEPA